MSNMRVWDSLSLSGVWLAVIISTVRLSLSSWESDLCKQWVTSMVWHFRILVLCPVNCVCVWAKLRVASTRAQGPINQLVTYTQYFWFCMCIVQLDFRLFRLIYVGTYVVRWLDACKQKMLSLWQLIESIGVFGEFFHFRCFFFIMNSRRSSYLPQQFELITVLVIVSSTSSSNWLDLMRITRMLLLFFLFATSKLSKSSNKSSIMTMHQHCMSIVWASHF